jgi:hypothetical protein
LVAAVTGLISAGLIGVVGARTLIDSDAGQLADGAASSTPVRPVPYNSTSLVATVDDEGRLTSSVVIALEADGTGGTMMELAASADIGHGNFEELQPLATVWEVGGPDAYRAGVEAMTNLSFDVIEVVDPERFAQLVQPLGDLTVELPVAIRDESSDVTFGPGEVAVTSAEAAQLVTATDRTVPDVYAEVGRVAVWQSVARRVGNGIGSGSSIAEGVRFVPADLDEVFAQLFAGPVAFRALQFTVLDDEQIVERIDGRYRVAYFESELGSVVTHDLAEILIYMGSAAGSRLGAPVDGPTVRVVIGLGDDDLAATGMTRTEVLKAAIDRLLYVRSNVVSVAQLPDDGAPDVSQMVVADPSSAEAVRTTFAGVFGDLEVSVASTTVEGVDIDFSIGKSFLDFLATNTEAVPDAAPPTTTE